MMVMAPADENECRQMLYTAYLQDTPAAVRYPRGSGPGAAVAKQMTAVSIGKGEIRRTAARRTNRVALLAFGSMLRPALAAAEELDARGIAASVTSRVEALRSDSRKKPAA
jgi:1-deoxy-D-xylulose-5-phosphate synthase